MPPASTSHSYGIPRHPDGRICREAAMDENNATRDHERVQQQVKAAVAAYRAMLDTFVNHPERRVTSEAEPARLRPL
jgi:hypothetical protein